ncbi:MAG: TonB C-terminal domain-containing protein [Epsilonproteobacteria bacterium]|nr:TonB C-terminal domain-containing protein [Campylobacterota bacterium]
MDNKFHLTISIVIAICIYILIVFSIVLYLKNNSIEVDKFSSLPKETIIELDFVVQDNTNKSTQSKSEEITHEQLIEEQEQPSLTDTKKVSDLKSLFSNFSDIGTKQDIQNQQKDQQKNKIMSRFKSSIDTDKLSQKIELSKLVDLNNVTNNSKSSNIPSNKGNIDEYYSTINTIILTRWYKYPLITDINYLVSANITIDVNGNFSYVILKYSGDNMVDGAVKLFLKNQTLEKYPTSRDKLTKTIRINFMPYAN